MEVEVTHLVNRADDMAYYSASRAELGDDAGAVTWQNAMDCFDPENLDADPPLVSTEEQLQAARDWFAEFGAWEPEEIAAWNAQEVNALLLQFVAGDIREGSDSVYPGDDGRYWFYVGI